MTHKSTALPVAGRTVRLVNLNNRLYVPLRFLIEETLDMRWGGQRKRLLGMAERWKLADLLVTGNRRSVQQLCLPIALVTPYLWSLRPHNPETRAFLERLRDQWEPSLFAYLQFDTGELANVGGFLMAEIERCILPLVAEREALLRRISDLEAGRVQIASDLARSAARDRWGNKCADKALLVRIAELYAEGKTKADIARETGVSRTTVSLFISGKYKTVAADEAMAEILSDA